MNSYPFTFNVFAKARWLGRSILEVMVHEYRGETIEHYVRPNLLSSFPSSTTPSDPFVVLPKQMDAIRLGLVQINGSMVNFEQRVEAQAMLHHRIHRHEPPVADLPIDIVFQSDNIIAIDKPSSMPVHPTGRFRHNTVTFILAKTHNLKNLYPVHRLDKLTSGLLLFARNPHRAEEIASEIRATTAHKTYLARVEGEFPKNTKIICKEPILLSTDIGQRELNKVHPDGKPCETHFERVCYDGKESVVKCEPKTGRTHQIRVHLAHLGHPIVNDPLYNPSYRAANAESWELDAAQDDEFFDPPPIVPPTIDSSSAPSESLETPSEIASSSSSTNDVTSNSPAPVKKVKAKLSTTPVPSANGASRIISFGDEEIIEQAKKDYLAKHQWIPNEPKIDIETTDPKPLCNLCSVTWRTPKPHQLRMFLHALKYEGSTFCYETKTPDWALPEWRIKEEASSSTS